MPGLRFSAAAGGTVGALPPRLHATTVTTPPPSRAPPPLPTGFPDEECGGAAAVQLAQSPRGHRLLVGLVVPRGGRDVLLGRVDASRRRNSSRCLLRRKHVAGSSGIATSFGSLRNTNGLSSSAGGRHSGGLSVWLREHVRLVEVVDVVRLLLDELLLFLARLGEAAVVETVAKGVERTTR